MKNSNLFIMAGLVLILSLSLGSASTLAAGKVYNSDFSGSINGASVDISCNSYTLSTTSANDGSFWVKFTDGECPLDSVAKAYASYGSLYGSETGIVREMNSSSDSNKTAVINVPISYHSGTPTSSRGSGSASIRVYLCGNGKCDTGESYETCSKDCALPETNITEENVTAETIPSEEQPQKRSGITGAFIGVGNFAGNYWWIILILAVLAAVYFLVRKKSRK